MTRIKPFLAIALLAIALPARAQDNLLDYVKNHASVVSGVASANGERSEFVSLAVDVDFEMTPKLRGFGYLSLFGRQRVDGGSVVTPGIPMSLDELALYSAGEIGGGAYYLWTPKVALECRGGVSFKMVALTGQKGDPVDSSKFLGACGPRLTGGPGRLSILIGHYGAVDEGEKFFGFAPSLIFDGSFRMSEGIDFLVFVASGRDLTTQKAVTTSRFALRKAF